MHTHMNKNAYMHAHKHTHIDSCTHREDCSIDEFIDIIEGNRKYKHTVTVYNCVCGGGGRRVCTETLVQVVLKLCVC